MPPDESVEQVLDTVESSTSSLPPGETEAAQTENLSDEEAWARLSAVKEPNPFGDDDGGDSLEDQDKAGGETEKAPKPGEAQAKQEPEKKAAATSYSEDEQKAAMRALRRERTPQALIDKMLNENPDALVEWGLDLAEKQRNVDGYSEKMAQLQSELSSLRGDKPAQQAAAPGSDIDFDALVKPIAERFDPELSSTFKDALKTITDKLTRQHQQEQARLREELGNVAKHTESVMVERARERLKERFPQTENASVWRQVRAKAEHLAKAGGYGSVDEIMTDAAKIVLHDHAQTDYKIRLAMDREDRANGTPTPPPRNGNPANTPMSPQEWEREVFRRSSRGESEKQIAKAIGHRAPRNRTA